MASSEADSKTNSLTNRSVSSSRCEEEIRPNELKGWLMKRSRLSRKWKKQYFLLKTTDLLYGNSPECLKKKIPLIYSEISETSVDKKSFAFSIKPKDSGRTYYLQAENESTQNDWMQAICFAKAAGQLHGDNSQACAVM